jgi:hypothetical protein
MRNMLENPRLSFYAYSGHMTGESQPQHVAIKFGILPDSRASCEGYPRQKKLLDEILAGPLFIASDLPPVPPEAHEAPRLPRRGSGSQGEFIFKSDDSEEDA